MGLVEQESDFVAGYLKYKTEQLRMASESLASNNPFTQERAKAYGFRLGTRVMTREIERSVTLMSG
jgi:hypothetical protein